MNQIIEHLFHIDTHTLPSPHRWFGHVFHPTAFPPEEFPDHTRLHVRVVAGLLVERVTALHCGVTVAVARGISKELVQLVDFWEEIFPCFRVVLRKGGGHHTFVTMALREEVVVYP